MEEKEVDQDDFVEAKEEIDEYEEAPTDFEFGSWHNPTFRVKKEYLETRRSFPSRLRLARWNVSLTDATQERVPPKMSEKVIKLALASRVILLALQLLCNSLLPDHHPDVFRSPSEIYVSPQAAAAAAAAVAALATPQPAIHQLEGMEPPQKKNVTTPKPIDTLLDRAVHFCLGGLRHWDAEYFLHIAEHTYSYENALAFYPLYPMVVRSAAQWLHTLSRGMGLSMSLRSWALVAAVTLNLFFFCKAVTCLYELTQRIFCDGNKSWNAALLFCFNPASIFFTAAYSEALFCWLSLQLMIACITEMRTWRITSTLALTIVSRSNGLVNAGFPIYFFLRKLFLRPVRNFMQVFRLLFCLVFALIPLTIFYFYAFQQFCLPARNVTHAPQVVDYAQERNYVLAGNKQPQNSPWCNKSFPFPYAYIQSHYWQVGFMRYYEFKQLPNFMLAFPVLAFLFYHCYKYLNHVSSALLPKYPIRHLVDEFKSFPFVVHAFFLALFCTFFVHIQISTRLLCSSTPCLYWFAADHMPKTFDQIRLRSKAGAIVCWFGVYYLLGTLLFSNNLPWT